MPESSLPFSKNAISLLHSRYVRRDTNGKPLETIEDLFKRVATTVASAEKTPDERQKWAGVFYEMMTSQAWEPNSPTLANAGREKGANLSACFVVNPKDEMESILQTQMEWGMIEKWGGGVGAGLSKIRPKDDTIATTHGKALGPIAVMSMLAHNASLITQGSFRSGAHMMQLDISHPDIREFISCKDADDRFANVNISVHLTDAFMQAVETDGEWQLVNPHSGRVHETMKAREIFQEVCTSAWKTGDPGVMFIDRVHETFPTPQLGQVETTNPCGEQALLTYESCTLGSINLSKFVNSTHTGFDWEALRRIIWTAVRFLDNVVDINQFPLQKLKDMNSTTRRIGLGVMGWADALAVLGLRYDSDKAVLLAEETANFLTTTAWEASAALAVERGEFPAYKGSRLEAKGRPPTRNSCVTSIAPTGSISRIADCSSGIEPFFARAWWSNILWEGTEKASRRLLDAPQGIQDVLVGKVGREEAEKTLAAIADRPEEAESVLARIEIDPRLFPTANNIAPEWHVKMLAAWQSHISSGVSKTINLATSATVEDVAAVYRLAWQLGCKSITVYRDGSKSAQVLETGSTKKVRKAKTAIHAPTERPAVVHGETRRVQTGHGNMYVTLNKDSKGKPFEVFATLGKSGGCDSSQIEAISRLISLAFRSGIGEDEVVKQLKGITCCPVWDSGEQIKSIADGIAVAIMRNGYEDTVSQTHAAGGLQTRSSEARSGAVLCPKCSEDLVRKEGCISCARCGYSKCD